MEVGGVEVEVEGGESGSVGEGIYNKRSTFSKEEVGCYRREIGWRDM